MSERTTRRFGARFFGARFWEAVECEIEALDAADYALFLAADRLEIEPRPGFERALESELRGLCRRRWSN